MKLEMKGDAYAVTVGKTRRPRHHQTERRRQAEATRHRSWHGRPQQGQDDVRHLRAGRRRACGSATTSPARLIRPSSRHARGRNSSSSLTSERSRDSHGAVTEFVEMSLVCEKAVGYHRRPPTASRSNETRRDDGRPRHLAPFCPPHREAFAPLSSVLLPTRGEALGVGACFGPGVNRQTTSSGRSRSRIVSPSGPSRTIGVAVPGFRSCHGRGSCCSPACSFRMIHDLESRLAQASAGWRLPHVRLRRRRSDRKHRRDRADALR